MISIAQTMRAVEDLGDPFVLGQSGSCEISVVVLREDSNMEYVPIETFYSSVVQVMVRFEGLTRYLATLVFSCKIDGKIAQRPSIPL